MATIKFQLRLGVKKLVNCIREIDTLKDSEPRNFVSDNVNQYRKEQQCLN